MDAVGDVQTVAVKTRRMGIIGAAVICINTMNGPGLLALSQVFQAAGGVVPGVGLAFIAVVSYFSGVYLSSTVHMGSAFRPPGADPSWRPEFCELFRIFFGEKTHLVSQLLLNLCLMSLAMAQMIVGAQVADALLVFLFGKSFAFQYYPFDKIEFLSRNDPGLKPFGEGLSIISLGFVIVMVACLALSALDLSENVTPQIISFSVLVISSCVFLYEFIFQIEGQPVDTQNVSFFGDNYATTLGVVIFNFSFVFTIPSIANELRAGADIRHVVGIACGFMLMLYCVVGSLGAMAYHNVHENIMENLLQGRIYTKIAVFCFCLAVFVPCIPVYFVLMRYNLQYGKIFGPKISFFVSTIFPWLLSAFLYQGSYFQQIINWTSLLINGFINFVFPLVLYVVARYRMSGTGVISAVDCEGADNAIQEFIDPVEMYDGEVITPKGGFDRKESGSSTDNVPSRLREPLLQRNSSMQSIVRTASAQRLAMTGSVCGCWAATPVIIAIVTTVLTVGTITLNIVQLFL